MIYFPGKENMMKIVSTCVKVFAVVVVYGPVKSLSQSCASPCTCHSAGTSRVETAVNCANKGLKKLPEKLSDIVNLISIDLSHNGFTQIPSSIPSSVGKLNLSHNEITSVGNRTRNHLYSLEELYLGHNDIKSIEGSDFGHSDAEDAFPHLRKLSLSNNHIETLGDAPFRSMPLMRALTLSHNQLEKLSANLFLGVSILEFVDFSHNRISTIQKGTFKNLHSLKFVHLSWNKISEYPVELPMLEWLDLSHNSIEHISEDQKVDVYPVEILNLAHNPLVCDCTTRWLKELYDRREYILKYIKIPHEEFVPTCASPSTLAGDSWNLLGDDVFRCANGQNKPDDSFDGDPETLLHNDPANVDLKGFTSKHKISDESEYEYIVNVMASLSKVESKSAVVKWILDDPDEFCEKLYIQYYQVGSKDSTALIAPVSSDQKSYVMRHLEPETLYRACVLPATSSSEVPSTVLSPTQCVQFVTVTDNDSELTDAKNLQFILPTSEEITVYSKLIGFSFVVSVIITGACMFLLEIIAFCYRLFNDKNSIKRKVTIAKSHTD